MGMKRLLPFLLIPLALGGLLSSCRKEEKAAPAKLLYGQLYQEEGDPHSHFVQSIRAFGDERRITHLTPYSTIKGLAEKKESFVLGVVPSFGCLCWSSFRDGCLLPYMQKHNLRVYLIEQSDLFASGNASFGLQQTIDPTLAIFSEGSLLAQQEAVSGEAFHDSPSAFASWMDEKIASFPKMLYVDDGQLDALYAGAQDFTIYYARSSCSDCAYFQTNFLNDYLKDRKGLENAYLIDCDQEGIRYRNGVEDLDQWQSYKDSHGLSEAPDNPAGYGTGYVPSLFHIAPKDGKKVGAVIQAADVVFNDQYEKGSDGYKISRSYFSEDRLESPALSYLKEGKAETKVLEGLRLGQYDGEFEEKEPAIYSWVQKKVAPFHFSIAKAFLDSF